MRFMYCLFADEDAKDFYRLAKSPKVETAIIPKSCVQSLLTVDDSRGAANGLPLQQYDAFLIYAEDDEEDAEFAGLMMKELTELRDLKVILNFICENFRYIVFF